MSVNNRICAGALECCCDNTSSQKIIDGAVALKDVQHVLCHRFIGVIVCARRGEIRAADDITCPVCGADTKTVDRQVHVVLHCPALAGQTKV